MTAIIDRLRDGLLYRGGPGHWNFLIHRFAGLGTLAFLTIHILDTATVYFYPSLYDHAIALYRTPLFMIGEIILIGCIFFHGVNGLKIILFDYVPGLWTIENERKSLPVVYAVTLGLWLPSAAYMLRHVFMAASGSAH